VQAQAKTIKFANQNAKGHPVVSGMERFAELVEAKSNRKLKGEKMKPVIAKHAANVGEATVNAVMTELERLRK